MKENQRDNLRRVAKDALDYTKETHSSRSNNKKIVLPIIAAIIIIGIIWFFQAYNGTTNSSKNQISVTSTKPTVKKLNTGDNRIGQLNTDSTNVDLNKFSIVLNFYKSLNLKKLDSLNNILSDTVVRYDSWSNKEKNKIIRLVKNHCVKVNFEKDSIHMNTVNIKPDEMGFDIEFKSTYIYQLRKFTNGQSKRLNKIKINNQNKIYYYNSMVID